MRDSEFSRDSILKDGLLSAYLLECFRVLERASHPELQERQGYGKPDPMESKPVGSL